MRFFFVLTAFVVILSASTSLSAAEVGDNVQFERAGQAFSGTVVGIRPGGTFLEVETLVGGTKRKVIVKATSVTPVGRPERTLRTWTDASGKFRVEATLESQTAFELVLRKEDGALIKVPLEKLSAADQEYVASLDASGTSENPFESGAVGAAPSAGRAEMSAAGGELPAPVVFAKRSNLTVQKLPPPKSVAADPSPLDFSKIDSASMQLPEAESRDEVGRPVIIDASGTQLCYNVRSHRGAQNPFTRMYLIDGKARKTTQVAMLAGDSVWLSTADPTSGDVLGVVMKRGDDKARGLCVISGLRDGTPRVAAHWRMFPDNENKSDHVRYRKLLRNQVAVVVYGGQVHAFDYGKKQEIWTLPSQSFNEPAITPGGQFAAVMSDNQCAILETKTGKQIGSIPCAAGPASLGFSSDGLRLAVAQGTQVRVIDVAAGDERLLHEANVPLAGLGKPIMWLDDEFLLLPTGLLLSLKRNLIVWKYNLDQDAIEYTDLEHQGLLTFKGRNSTAIVRLPHAAAREAAERDTSGITAVKAGESLSVRANGSGPGASQNELLQWMGDAANRAGYTESNSAPTELVASITRGETKKETYRILGRGFGTEEVTFTPYITKVEIRQQGKTIWQQSRVSGLPFMISGDKTLQEAARDNERPDAKFLQNVKLPSQVLKPEFQNGFGSSRVSAAGIADL